MSEFFKIICQDCGDECFQGGKDGITWICPTCDNDPVKPPAAAQGMAQAVEALREIARIASRGDVNVQPLLLPIQERAEQALAALDANVLATAKSIARHPDSPS